MGFRALYLILSLYLIAIGLLSLPKKLPLGMYIFLLFWVIYGIRLVYDIEFRGVTFQDKSGFYIYGYAFGNSLIPALAVFLNTSLLKGKRLIDNLFLIVLMANLCILLPLVFIDPGGIMGVLTKRSELIVFIHEIPVNLINAITISFFGGILSLVTFWLLLNRKKFGSWYHEMFIWFLLLVGLFNLLAGASKGPFISFLIVGFYMVIVWVRSHDTVYRSKKIWYPVLITIVLALAATGILYWQFERISNMMIFTRLENFLHWGSDASSNVRMELWKSALNQFLAHPFIGDKFLTDYLNFYPHNLILEALMATGILGTFFFLSFIVQPFYFFYRLPKEDKSDLMIIWIALLAVFLLAMVTGGLFSSPDFWIMSAVAIGLFQQYTQKKLTVSEPKE